MAQSRHVTLIVSIGLLFAIVIFVSCSIVRLPETIAFRQAEHEIGQRLGIEPSITAINEYLNHQLIVGRTKADAFALLEKIKSHPVVPTGLLGTVWDVPGAECFYAGFDDVLARNRVLNRYLCFDRDAKLIFVAQELELY